MQFGYSRPSPITPAIAGTGASFVTPASALFNGRPADATRVQWLSGAQTTASVVQIQATWSKAIVPGIVGLFGLNLLGLASSAGLKFVFMGQRVGDTGFPYVLGGNTALVRSVTRSDGSTCAIGVCDAGLTPIIGLQMSIYNDQNGAANIAASQNIDLGDLWVSPSFDADIEADWKLSFVDKMNSNVSTRTSINWQPWTVPYPPARTLSASKKNMQFSDAYVDGTNPCYQTMRTLAGNGQVSVQIPRWGKSGAVDAASVHATAVFGLSTFNELDRANGELFSLSWTQQEIPALLA